MKCPLGTYQDSQFHKKNTCQGCSGRVESLAESNSQNLFNLFNSYISLIIQIYQQHFVMENFSVILFLFISLDDVVNINDTRTTNETGSITGTQCGKYVLKYNNITILETYLFVLNNAILEQCSTLFNDTKTDLKSRQSQKWVHY